MLTEAGAKRLAEEAWGNLYGEPEDLASSYGIVGDFSKLTNGTVDEFKMLGKACLEAGFDQLSLEEPGVGKDCFGCEDALVGIVISQDALAEGMAYEEMPLITHPERPWVYSRKRIIGRYYPVPGMSVGTWPDAGNQPDNPTLAEIQLCQDDEAYWHLWLRRQGYWHYELFVTLADESYLKTRVDGHLNFERNPAHKAREDAIKQFANGHDFGKTHHVFGEVFGFSTQDEAERAMALLIEKGLATADELKARKS